MMQYWLWGLVTLLLNANNTALARARTSGSLTYHSIMAATAGLVWIFNQLFAVNILWDVWHKHKWDQFTIVTILYIIVTVVGSVGSHFILMKYIEKGKARVGER